MSYYGGWAPYVPVAERRRRAAAAMAKRAKKGQSVCPVVIEGRAIATTPWGKAWCSNLEAYADFSNRLPRGRTYARNGSVVDLQLRDGRIQAHVSGSSLYRTTITVKPVAKAQWKAICADCAGSIESLVDLLQGRLADGVMRRLCRQGDGLFPTPKDLSFDCSCPDWADMCKHVAAVLYGIGNRLDQQPELLFTLRGVDPADLIASAGAVISTATTADQGRVLADDDLGALFGLEMATPGVTEPAVAASTAQPRPAKAAQQPPKLKAKRKPAAASRRGPAQRPAATKTAKATTPPPSGRGLYPRLYRLLHKHGTLTNAAAQDALGVEAATLRPLFKQLIAGGHATVSGRTRGTIYHAT